MNIQHDHNIAKCVALISNCDNFLVLKFLLKKVKIEAEFTK